jgi:hypothetical protein
VQIGRRIEPEVQEFVFDGMWMVERKPALNQVIRQQIARQGESFDPLQLGQGPFPIPLGQKAQAIRERYEAALLAPEDELMAHEPAEQAGLAQFVKGTHQLRLIPRAELLPTEELKEIRLWYRREEGDKGELLPRLARTVNRAGDVTIVQMIGVKSNQPVPPEVMNAATPAGWTQDVRELAPATDPGAPAGR